MLRQIKALLLFGALLTNLSFAQNTRDNGSVEAFVGYKSDLKLDRSLTLDDDYHKHSHKAGDKNAAFIGLNLYYSSEHLVLNAIIVGKSGDPEKAEVKSLSAFKNFRLNETTDFGLAAGNIVIPFGLNETQRLYPNVITPRGLNSNVFSEFVSSDIVEPTNNGILFNLTRNHVSFKTAIYQPRNQRFLLITEDFQRLKFTGSKNLGIGDDMFSVPVLTVDFRNINLTNPESFKNPASVEFKEINVRKRTLFQSITYDNSRDLVIDLEYAISRGKSSNTDYLSNIRESYFYLGAEKTVGRYTFLAETSTFNSTALQTQKLNAYNATVTYDTGRTLYMLSASTVRGNILNARDYSIGFTHRIVDNLYARVLYRKVNGSFSERIFSETLTTCSGDVECKAIKREVNENTRTFPISADGIEVRMIYYF